MALTHWAIQSPTETSSTTDLHMFAPHTSLCNSPYHSPQPYTNWATRTLKNPNYRTESSPTLHHRPTITKADTSVQKSLQSPTITLHTSCTVGNSTQHPSILHYGPIQIELYILFHLLGLSTSVGSILHKSITPMSSFQSNSSTPCIRASSFNLLWWGRV